MNIGRLSTITHKRDAAQLPQRDLHSARYLNAQGLYIPIYEDEAFGGGWRMLCWCIK
ncbi:hypothetical protein O9929_03310 [Vibrio lentus]|nr:hypothetical protein [Vibrio lentus]